MDLGTKRRDPQEHAGKQLVFSCCKAKKTSKDLKDALFRGLPSGFQQRHDSQGWPFSGKSTGPSVPNLTNFAGKTMVCEEQKLSQVAFLSELGMICCRMGRLPKFHHAKCM